jgi:putative hydrolase of the HAD superfamily
VISLVLFDLDDTLFAHGQAVADGIVAYTGDPDAARRWHSLEEEHYHRYLAGELDYLGQRRARVRGYADHELTDLQADEFFAGYHAAYVAAWQLHYDAIPGLDALSHLHLGLITNGDPENQAAKIEGLGITARFEHIIASGALGYVKPDPRIFRYACDRFAISASSALYVGDRLQTDAIGAAAAGLTGVWLDRAGAATPADLAAAAAAGVHVIASLDELPPSRPPHPLCPVRITQPEFVLSWPPPREYADVASTIRIQAELWTGAPFVSSRLGWAKRRSDENGCSAAGDR